MSYQIITDSCCDFTEQMFTELNVKCVPLTVMYNGENHTNFYSVPEIKKYLAAL